MSGNLDNWRAQEARGKEADAEAERQRTVAKLAEVELEKMKAQQVSLAPQLPVVMPAIGRVLGPALAIHLVWALCLVALCWILVVHGWRGGAV